MDISLELKGLPCQNKVYLLTYLLTYHNSNISDNCKLNILVSSHELSLVFLVRRGHVFSSP